MNLVIQQIKVAAEEMRYGWRLTDTAEFCAIYRKDFNIRMEWEYFKYAV